MKLTENTKNITIIILVALLFISFTVNIITSISKFEGFGNDDVSSNIMNDLPSDIRFRETFIKDTLTELTSYLGQPTKLEFSDFYFEGAVWQLDYNLFDKNQHFGHYKGLDYIKISGHVSKKWHPLPAIVYIIVGKYMSVPDFIIGHLKHASETINIEQLFIPTEYAEKYYDSGVKDFALVTGSCASVTISALTIKFCEDMLNRYKTEASLPDKSVFRDEYDRRILKYLCGKGMDAISWYKPEDFGEDAIYNTNHPMCSTLERFTVNKEGFSHCEAINDSVECSNEGDCNWSEIVPGKGTCRPKPS